MEINAHQKPMIMVFNKIDAFAYEKKDEDDLTPATKKEHFSRRMEKNVDGKI